MEKTIGGLHLLVHVAENGQSFELECESDSSVELVQEWLASLTHVAVQDQLLICGETRLEAQRPLAFYKLPAQGRDIFLFNRTRLTADSSPPMVELPAVTEVVLPPPPSSSLGSHPLDEALDPALKALPSYERQFKYHLQKGHAIFTASKTNFEACRRLLREQQIQKMALETATGNMDHYFRIIDQMYRDFIKQFNLQHKQHADILTNVEKDLDRLRSCKLHPALLSKNYRTLLDCIREPSVRKSFETCSVSHKQFQTKVQQLKHMHMELQQSVEELSYKVPSVNIPEVEVMVDNHKRFIDEETIIMQSLSKDVNTVRKLVEECLSNQLSVSVRPHDAVSALGPMYDVHEKSHLPGMEVCSKDLCNLLEYCKARKRDMSLCVHTCVQRVATLQSSIRDVRNQLSAFKEALTRQDEIFSDLKLVRRIGPAYRACLAEAVRRKAEMKLYMGQAGQLAEKLAQKRESEIARREEFLKLQSSYVPEEILRAMGLFDVPSQCVVNIAPYDTNLLDVDIGDLERYAPESLFGPTLKGYGSDKSQQESNIISKPGSGSYLGGGEDNIIIGEGFNLGINEDERGSEIAGASKMEVENAWLKAELASAIALLCTLNANADEFVPDDDNNHIMENNQRNVIQRTAEALELKDEYAKHLQNMLKMSHMQCTSYEKRIRELEQRLANQCIQQKPSVGASGEHLVDVMSPQAKEITFKSDASGITGDNRMITTASILDQMDGVSSSAGLETEHPGVSNDSKHTNAIDHVCRFGEGDESMSDFSGGGIVADATMLESQQDSHDTEKEVGRTRHQVNRDGDTEIQQLVDSRSINAVREENDKNTSQEAAILLREKDDKLLALEAAWDHKAAHCAVLEERLKAALEDIACLRAELEGNVKLFSECQMNCAHLENRLHEVREEARINLCAADRRAIEYNALRSSFVKLCSLVERLHHCISISQNGTIGFSESLRLLAVSLGRSDNADDGSTEFRACIRILSERVSWLAQQRSELLERCTKADLNQARLSKELESTVKLVNSLYSKKKGDKQGVSTFPSSPVSEGSGEEPIDFHS